MLTDLQAKIAEYFLIRLIGKIQQNVKDFKCCIKHLNY